MRKLFVLAIIIISCISVYAQQLPVNSQYMLNKYLINPAAAGIYDYAVLSLTAKKQWSGINDAPNTQSLSFHNRLGDNQGYGGILFNDIAGPFRRTGIQLSYSYRIEVTRDSKLSFSLGGKLNQHSLNTKDYAFHDQVDPVIGSETPKAIVIENENVKKTFENYFNFIWKHTKNKL
ncbi:MAG: PorP/SprF family type IX secretion system membrane protein [Bacteroidetes bacterium]|nr:PorP/SprF family type IX secretion system membrane protein [Bacteroidota bacterium]